MSADAAELANYISTLLIARHLPCKFFLTILSYNGGARGFVSAMGGALAMRNFLMLLVGLSAAYWVDQTYYAGVYSRSVAEMFHQIASSYK